MHKRSNLQCIVCGNDDYFESTPTKSHFDPIPEVPFNGKTNNKIDCRLSIKFVNL